jgi:hypothetical protein
MLRNLVLVGLLLLTAAGVNAKLIVFGGVTDNAVTSFPDTVFTGLGIWNGASAIYSSDSFAIYPNNFGTFDQFYAWTRTNHLKFIWYGGFIGAYGGSFGPPDAATYNAFLRAVAARAPGIEYINYCNEGVAHGGAHAGEPFANAYGGAGTTGVDWIINLGRAVRAAFPHAKIGINDFEIESSGNDLAYGCYGCSASLIAQTLPKLRALRSAGVLDFIGLEGYSMETSSDPNIISALNQLGAIAPVIYTEFSPYANNGSGIQPATVMAGWQRLLPELAANPNCIGIFGPWDYRWSMTQGGGIQGSQFFIDDRVSPPVNEPVVAWLKGVVPSLVGPPSPTPTPTPSATPTPTPSPSPVSTPTPAPTPSPTPTPSPSPVPAPTPTPTPAPTYKKWESLLNAWIDANPPKAD